MDLRLPTLMMLFSLPSTAGTVLFDTDTEASVEHGNTTIARASGPGVIALGEFPTGTTQLILTPANRPPLRISVAVPESEPVTIELRNGRVQTAGTTLVVEAIPAPRLGLRSADGERFTVVLNGDTVHTLRNEIMIDDLTPGRHAVEVRSADRLTIWARGTVDLMAGETVVLGISSGRMVVADGLSTAWRAHSGDAQ